VNPFTMAELRAWVTAAILFFIAVLLTGCASIQQYQVEQARLQTLTDRITTHYRVAPIPVRVTSESFGQFLCHEHVINLPKGASDFLVSHEAGHVVLGNGCIGRLESELAANEFAIQAMQDVLGWSARGAADAAVQTLISAQWRHLALPGEHAFCAEAADVLTRHPEATVTLGSACPATAGR
jgi:hypothetical protein